MIEINRILKKVCLFGVVIFACVSCAPISRPDLGRPMGFDQAVRSLTFDLFAQIFNKSDIPGLAASANFVADSIINADTGDEMALQKNVLRLIQSTVAENFPKYNVAGMDLNNLDLADYVITGILQNEKFNNSLEKIPRLYMSAVQKSTGQIVAHSEAWGSNQNVDFRANALYSDSPMYLKDKRINALIATAKATAGSEADREYFDNLTTSALLHEAAAVYDMGNYQLALGLFAKAAERQDGMVMKTFAGLYESFLKLNQLNKAEDAFGKLTELGIQNGNISVKFLFTVNKTAFSGDSSKLSEYGIWLRQISQKIADSNSCMQILGHASHSGNADYNKKLSLKRAAEIRKKLETETVGVAEKTFAIGRGFEENIIGSGTNDESDAIDRRVEFKVVDCSRLAMADY